jgi:hypothetical protein
MVRQDLDILDQRPWTCAASSTAYALVDNLPIRTGGVFVIADPSRLEQFLASKDIECASGQLALRVDLARRKTLSMRVDRSESPAVND